MKLIVIFLISLSSIVLFPIISAAQELEDDGSFILSGKVVDAATLEGIPYSHIKLDDTYWGVICDSLGFFKVRVKDNQNLKVSSLGFAEKMIPITEEITDGSAFQELHLDRTSYMLEDVDIYSLGTWEQFRHNFVKTELANEEVITENWNIGNLKQYMKASASLDRPGAGVGISYNRKFRDRKQREHVFKLKAQEGKIYKLKQKFNKQIVQDITNEKGVRLDALIVYITEREHFTYQSRDTYIQKRIKACYLTFLDEYVDGEYVYGVNDSTKTLRNHLRK